MEKIIEKILIIRLSSIGDIVLTSPIIRALKSKFPKAELHFLTKEQFVDLVQYNPYISNVFLLDNALDILISKLKNEHFDLVIDLQDNWRSKWIKYKLSVKTLTYAKDNFHKFSLVYFKKSVFKKRHIVDRYFSAINALGIQNDNKGLDFFIPKNIENSVEDVVQKLGNEYAVLVLGAAHFTKTIPLEILNKIILKIEIPIVLLGGKNEMENGELLSKIENKKIIDLTGKTDLLTSGAWLKFSEFIVTPDTGMMHIGAALGKKMYIVWGATVPALGFTAYMPDSKAKIVNLEVDHLTCRPCSRMGTNSCPKKHFKCMLNQDIDNIIFC